MTPLYGLSGTRLPVHPQPLPDELLTHWFMRLAHANQVKAQTLADWTFGKPSSFWARDQDKLASPAIITRLADISGKNPDDLLALTLAPYEGIIYQHHNPNGNTRWIMPLGVYHRTRRRYGMQFCPLCLATDAEPYFRRSWRLAFATVCERHGTLMHDRCHQCGAPVTFFRRELGHREEHRFGHVALCHACGSDLSRAPAWDASAGDVHALIQLRSLATFHDMGWSFCGKEVYQFEHLFMDALHRMCSFLSSAKGRKLLAVATGENRLAVMEVTGNGREFESRPLLERHYLLLAALWLLAEWPDRFVTACRQARLSRTAVTREEHFPWWYEKALREHLDRSRYVATAEEAANVAAYLARAGEDVSATKVGKILGGKDKGAASAYRKSQRHGIPSGDELDGVIAALEMAIRKKEVGSVRRLLQERDQAIFRFMRITGWPAKRVLGLSVADAVRLAKTVGTEAALPAAARGVLLNYLRDVRRFLAGEASGNALFVGQKGGGIGVKNLGLRVHFANG